MNFSLTLLFLPKQNCQFVPTSVCSKGVGIEVWCGVSKLLLKGFSKKNVCKGGCLKRAGGVLRGRLQSHKKLW